MGVLATTFTALAYNLTLLRDEGVLKRIRGTPMPAGAYLAGFIGSATLNAILQVTLVVTIGNLLYGVDWPQDWLLLAAFTVLGRDLLRRRSASPSRTSSRTRRPRPRTRTRSSCR